MSEVHEESGWEFEFVGAIGVDKLDAQGQRLPQGMSLVDFVVEETDRCLLLEVKNPSATPLPHRTRQADAQRVRRTDGSFISEKLVPKARDSYTYLHLMARDDKPLVFVLLDDPSLFGPDAALLLPREDDIIRHIRHEAAEPWKRLYIRDCIVVTPDTWSRAFPEYALRRAPTIQADLPPPTPTP